MIALSFDKVVISFNKAIITLALIKWMLIVCLQKKQITI